ncbi:RidA family protein [Mesorhizobium sp. CAU 1732]|uniref:RidA family protein n=1 Tax=Mesorhizobium sp. CAU 1732 TaxID=3140358 RepID=UPI003261A84A
MSKAVFISENRPPRTQVPQSQIAKAGDFLFLSGVSARSDDGKVVGHGDIKAQTRQIFTNIQSVLAVVGCDLTDIIRLTTYLATPASDLEAAHKYIDTRMEFFGDHRPASTGVNVAGLMLPEMLVEVDVIAYAPHAVIGPNAKIIGGAK